MWRLAITWTRSVPKSIQRQAIPVTSTTKAEKTKHEDALSQHGGSCLVATAAVLVMASGKSVVVAKADLKTWSWKSSAGIPAERQVAAASCDSRRRFATDSRWPG
jgi:hypothetical protein